MRSKTSSTAYMLIVFIAVIGLTGTVHSQSIPLPTGKVAAFWKLSILAEIDDRLAGDPINDSFRNELESRKTWLEEWIPGHMTDEPRINSHVPQLRNEPILESVLSNKLRKQLTWKSTDCDKSDILLLRQTLAGYPNDLGLQQLNIQWLDLSSRRKQHLEEIEISVRRFIDSLVRQESPSPEMRLATEFAMYRLGRALAYRELPDVVKQTPIKDPDKLSQQILLAYNNLIAVAGTGRSEFILLEIRILRREGSYGKSLVLLEKYASVIKRKWYLKKRRDLLKELEWKLPNAEAAQIYAKDFPTEKGS